MKESDVEIEDIAHALSMLCRYNGHVDQFYSVAQHSVLVAEQFEHYNGQEGALAALLHDAAEAYVGDMISPIKKQMLQFQILEENILRVIMDKFDLWSVYLKHESNIHRADKELLRAEMDYFYGDKTHIHIKDGWKCIWPMPQPEVKILFLNCFERLMKGV